MAINYDRIILKSSLDKIIEGSEIRENIANADAIIKKTLSEVDLLNEYGKKHGNSHWVEKAIEEKDLRTVGNYQVKTSGSSPKKVEFSQDGYSLIFSYKQLEGMAGHLKMIANMILSNRLNVAEFLMGNVKNAEIAEMDYYELKKVELAMPSKIPLFKKRKIIYNKD